MYNYLNEVCVCLFQYYRAMTSSYICIRSPQRRRACGFICIRIGTCHWSNGLGLQMGFRVSINLSQRLSFTCKDLIRFIKEHVNECSTRRVNPYRMYIRLRTRAA